MHRIFITALAVSLFVLPFAWSASAQEVQPQPEAVEEAEREAPRAIEEITVTARRRDELAQKVPISLTALTNADLQMRSIERVEDLNYNVPNLSISNAGSRGRNLLNYQIRGVEARQTLTDDPSVGIYYNGVVQARPHGSNQQLYDLETVQVLKGPQGTLFGRSTMGGAILYETRRPTDEFESEVKVTFGSEDRHDLYLQTNLPITENLAVRANYSFNRRDGYTDSVGASGGLGVGPGNGGFQQRALDNIHSDAWRFSLLWQPTERLETFFVHDGYSADETGHAIILTSARPNGVASRFTPFFGAEFDVQAELTNQNARGIRNMASNIDQFDSAMVLGTANITTFDVTPNITLKNLIGWRRIDDKSLRDLDGSTLALLEVEAKEHIEQFSNELQLLGNSLDGRLEWITGLYYFEEKGEDQTHHFQLNYRNSAPDRQPSQNTPGSIRTGGTGKNTSYSWFAQATYELPWIEGLSLTGGWRWVKDVRRLTVSSATDSTLPDVSDCNLFEDDEEEIVRDPCFNQVSAKFREPVWTVSADYQWTDDFLGYVAHRHSYRSGGFNIRGKTPSEQLAFNPSKLDDIELGIKADWRIGDTLVRTNLAYYYMWWDEIQTNADFIGASGVLTSTTLNAAEAELQGFELELTVQPFDSLEIFLHGSHQDGEFTSFDTIGPTGLPVHRSGDPFIIARWRGGATVRYTAPLSPDIGEVVLSANYYAQSHTNAEPDEVPEGIQRKYHVLNLRADWLNVMGWPLDASLFLTNATDQEYVLSQLSIQGSFGFTAESFSEPRFWGLSLTYRFGG